MTKNLSKIQILKMIKDKNITAKEGYKLLQEMAEEEKNLRINKIDTSDVVCFEKTWKASDVINKTEAPNGKILIFVPEYVELINDRSINKIYIKIGEEYKRIGENCYQLNPALAADYSSLVDDLEKRSLLPNYILYGWGLEDTEPQIENYDDKLNIDDDSFSMSLYPLFYIIKAFGSYQLPMQILYIFYDGENEKSLIGKAAASLNKSLQMNYSGIALKTICLQKDNIDWQSIVHLCSIEISQSLKAEISEIKFQGGKRYIPAIVEVKENHSREISLKEDGNYLITGGLGSLGFIFASYLAKEYKANLVLIGKSELSKEKKHKIEMLTALGGTVFYIKADVSNMEELQQGINLAKDRLKKLDGCIHAAGTITDKLFKEKNISEIKHSLQGKIKGAINLDYVTRLEPLDFFVSFASISSILGDIGQVDYGFANSFLNAFSEYRDSLKNKGIRQGKFISINWPLWREGGMHIDEEGEKLYLASSGMEYLESKEGIELFINCLSMDCKDVYIIKGKKGGIRKILNMYEEEKFVDKEDKVQEISTEFLEKWVVNDLLNIVAPIIDVDKEKLQVTQNLGDYGFDSISLRELANGINEKYKTNINASIFFSKSNVKTVSNYLCLEFNELIQKYYRKAHIKDTFSIEKSEIPVKKSVSTKQISQKKQVNEVTAIANEEKIAIIGMSGAFPGSKDLDEFWTSLIDGRNLITRVPQNRWSGSGNNNLLDKEDEEFCWGAFLEDVDKFDADFFGITPREAELMDPQHRMYIENVWKAIEDSGYRASALNGKKIGVFTGIQFGDYRDLIKENNIINAHVTTGNAHTMISNRISFILNLHGPSEAIDTACSSSLVAINSAIRSIQTKECEMAIAGAVSLTFSQYTFLQAAKLGILSKDGQCKTFDKDANGYVKGEGVGVLLLKPLQKAIQDGDNIHAVIKGIAVNHGGRANSLTAPNAEAQTELLVEAYERANVDINTISYIETHGTGTKLGDPVEVEALKNAFNKLGNKNNLKLDELKLPQKKYCGLGSIKTNIGHLEPAAGVAGIIKVILAMKHKTIPANRNYNQINPYIQIENSPFYIMDHLKNWEPIADCEGKQIPRRAGVSCFGFGGTNAHIILEEYIDNNIANVESNIQRAFVLSAKTKDVLKKYAESIYKFIQKFIKGNKSEDMLEQRFLEDLTYTLQLGRESMEERVAFTFITMDDVLQKLRSFIENEASFHDIFVGSKDKNKKISEILADEDGRNYISILIGKNMLSKLLQLWVVGVEVDWNLIYEQSKNKNKISLPVYPFHGKRYWFDSFENQQVQKEQSISQENRISVTSMNVDIYEEEEVSLELLPGGIAIITIEDRVNKNMFTHKVIRGLKYQLQKVNEDTSIKAVIVTGYENVFCMGGTKEELISLADEEISFTDEPFLYRGLLECNVPVISMMSGHAFGGGFVFGMFADIVLLACESIYSANFMKYGFTPGLGATYILKEKLGTPLAMEMMFTAKQFDGKELKERGIPLIVKSRSDLYTEALSIARELCEKPYYALKVLKQELSGKILKDLECYLESEQLMHLATFTKPEVKTRIEHYLPNGTEENEKKEIFNQKIKLKQSQVGKQEGNLNNASSNNNSSSHSSQIKLIEAKLVSIVGYVLHVKDEEIDSKCTFKEIGIDSISCVEITRKVTKELHTPIDVMEFYDYSNIRELAKYILNKQGVIPSSENKGDDTNSKVLLRDKKSNRENVKKDSENRISQKKLLLTQKEQKKEGQTLIAKDIELQKEKNTMITSDIREVLIKIVANCLHVSYKDIDIQSSFKEMGVDSIMSVEIVREINKQFNIKLDSVELYDYSNISSMSDYICSLVNGKGFSTQKSHTEDSKGDTLAMLYQIKEGSLDIELADAWLEDRNESD